MKSVSRFPKRISELMELAAKCQLSSASSEQHKELLRMEAEIAIIMTRLLAEHEEAAGRFVCLQVLHM